METADDATAPEPSETAESEAVFDETEPAAAAAEPEPVPEPEPEPEPTPPAEPEPPRVVTRTRRRAASRPAGPPTSTAATEGSGGPEDTLGSGALEQPADETPALHVPVKRKGGARKR